ncbi:MAG: hypothetical protein K2K57_14010 [Oscillospiraceae bacterium]|nr:hypothetical protein [Oscillospiraceae bacterium]
MTKGELRKKGGYFGSINGKITREALCMNSYSELSEYGSGKNSGGGLFKAFMTVFMAGGAAVYPKAAEFTDIFAAKCGYGAIAFFCLLAACGILLTDMSTVKFMRTGTKACGVLLPLSANGGSAVCLMLLTRGMREAAAVGAGVSCVVFVICAGVILTRYRRNEL